MSGLLALGESMGLIRGAGIGALERLAEANIDTAGAEGNVAIGVARLGQRSAWIGRVGDDALGRRVVADLRSENVQVFATTDLGAPTGLMLKSTPRSGTTVVDYYRRHSAGSRIQPDDLGVIDFALFDVLHVTGISLGLSESSRATVHAAIARAKSAGLTVSFAVNHRDKVLPAASAVEHYRRVLDDVDVIFASEYEADLLAPGLDPVAQATELGSRGPAEVIITRGSAGAVACIDGMITQIDAVPVAVVDTVGAGDAFAAGYLAERLLGAAPRQRLGTAALAGALACTHPGDWQGYPRRSELRVDASDPVAR